MLKRLSLTLAFCLSLSASAAQGNLYELSFQTNDGKQHQLNEYKGKVLLIANTASRCGYTGQYEDLQSLHKKYKDKGLVVLGFPSTSFKQELPSDKEVADFCKLKYDVGFPLTRITEVKGENQHPVFRYLTQKGPSETQGEVAWNFEKFLVDRQGQIKARFRSKIEPSSPEFVQAVETLLK
jgi:glutathione peroxidase